jgi:hypothetical protein
MMRSFHGISDLTARVPLRGEELAVLAEALAKPKPQRGAERDCRED